MAQHGTRRKLVTAISETTMSRSETPMTRTERKPKAKLPFVPDCRVRCLGKVEPARFIARTKDCPLQFGWVQVVDGVFTVALSDLLRPTTEG
jgi:hypothetical protein